VSRTLDHYLTPDATLDDHSTRIHGVTVSRSHVRVTWGGNLGSQPGEHWTCSLSIAAHDAPPAVEAPAFSEAQCASIGGLLRQFHSEPKTGIRPIASLTWVKVARISDAGRYLGDAHLEEFQPVAGGATAGTTHPFQVARAVTLHTGRRGASYRGRFFLPLPNNGIDGDGTYAAAEATDVATQAAFLITGLNAVSSQPEVVVCVAGKNGNTAVTGVTVGRVLDTMRSRRRSLKEQYPADVPVVA
jgi:hypothetical protein